MLVDSVVDDCKELTEQCEKGEEEQEQKEVREKIEVDDFVGLESAVRQTYASRAQECAVYQGHRFEIFLEILTPPPEQG